MTKINSSFLNAFFDDLQAREPPRLNLLFDETGDYAPYSLFYGALPEVESVTAHLFLRDALEREVP